ncbi:MAG: sulfite exporter TauE/SafE family protein [Anaerolineae bacterium]|nr:sulfite exporter TauE/SafE family protein [Anaerolineae bacterium]
MSFAVIIITAALIVGLAKGGFGALGTLLTPLMSLIMPVQDAVGVILPLLMVGDWFALHAYRGTWDMSHVRRLLPTAVIGVIAGMLLLTNLPDTALRRILGIFTLIIIVYKLASDSLQNVEYTPRAWHGALAGSAAGFSSALANAGGPPMQSYLLLQRLSPTVYVGTNAVFFASVNMMKLPAFLAADVIDPDRLVGILWVIPLIPVGVWIGRRLIDRIPPKLFEWVVMVSLLWAAVMLLAT